MALRETHFLAFGLGKFSEEKGRRRREEERKRRIIRKKKKEEKFKKSQDMEMYGNYLCKDVSLETLVLEILV